VSASKESMSVPTLPPRKAIRQVPRALAIGPIARLMSPGDLGEILRPFVFLDLFDIPPQLVNQMPLHPHSGIATVTVVFSGGLAFSERTGQHGELTYGGVEWMRAGSGVWHGDELCGVAGSRNIRGFQLWVALPPELENSAPEAQYLRAESIPRVGPACLILGQLGSVQSPVRAPAGINYLLVTLNPEETWTYQPPEGHRTAWVAVGNGQLKFDRTASPGDIVIFEQQDGSIEFESIAHQPAVFVVGTAVPHPHELVMGSYSIHTNERALIVAEHNLEMLRPRSLRRLR
jgi:redox-sensitive bicupin YhaK (pirin superfamily)